jgi:outer membrane protein assembly factor BamB
MPKTAVRIALPALLMISRAALGAARDDAREVLDAAERATGLRGGLIIHLDCGDGRLTAELGRSGRFIVRGLERDDDAVAEARLNVAAAGVYGRTSVGRWDGARVPCMDNLANLIVCDERLETQPDLSDAEFMRALAPGGMLAVRKDRAWTRRVKPRPDNIDEWTHYLHGPGNNAVARDSVVGPPSRLQWLADPIHLRSHEHLNSISALVSAGGRIFYIIDEGATAAVAADPDWRLVARDAFNGVLLWKQKIGPWEGHFRIFRSGPPEAARRLVAVDGKVYATLGYGKRVAAFDAATGERVRTYDSTEGAVEIVCDGGRLFVVFGDVDTAPPPDPAKRFTATPEPRRKGVVALDAESGRVLWRRRDEDTSELMPTTLAVSGARVFFQNPARVICLGAASGAEAWRADRPVYTKRLSWSAPVLVVSDGVVLSADGSAGGLGAGAPKGAPSVEWVMSDRDIRRHPVGDIVALDAADGRRLWSDTTVQGFCNPGDVFVVDGRVWAGADVGSRQVLLSKALDLRTGEVVLRRPANGMPVAGHTRCYRNKATERFLLLGDFGVEFMKLDDWSWNANPWVRGTCQYGVMPCNGLLYAPPDSCACRPEMRLHGFSAMAPKPPGAPADAIADDNADAAPRLVRGPSFADARRLGESSAGPGLEEWPTYRCDGARSGSTESEVPSQLRPAWRAKIGGELTSLTVGAGKVFVSRVDAHEVVAIDRGTGAVAWRRTVGGPVDSPPTVHEGLVIFGSRDGIVRCLRADDGELVWRFNAAPEERFIVARGAVESAWPVHGSVLVREGVAWFAAGRSSYLDGGIRLWAVKADTGEVVARGGLNARGHEGFLTSRPKGNPPGRTRPMLPDILSTSGGAIYMRWMGFTPAGLITRSVKPHLFSATGFLDDTWWHRTYWQYGTWMSGGFGGWPKAARVAPSGRIMALGNDALFAFGRPKYDAGNGGDVHAGHVGLVKKDYQDEGRLDYSRNLHRLFSARIPGTGKGGKAGKGRARIAYNWQRPVPVLVRAMALAGGTLFIAGPRAGDENRGLVDLRADRPGLLMAISAADGKTIAELELASTPVFDGMAAPGRLYLSTVGGEVVCLGGR